MANRATTESVAADMRPANFRQALALIRGPIEQRKNKIQGINSEIGDQWGKVEGHKVNKKGAQIFAALDKQTPEDRADIMRTINGLSEAAGWDAEASDLVDQANGNVVPMRLKSGSSEPAQEEGDVSDENDAEIEGLVAEIEKPAEKKPRGRKPAVAAVPSPAPATDKTPIDQDGADSFVKQLKKAGEPRVATADLPPYTGDNSDLANTE